MKISGSPGERLPGRVLGGAGGRSRGHGEFPPQAEEHRLSAAAHVEPGHAARGRNHLSIRCLIYDGLAVDLRDQVALAQAGPVGAAPQIDAGHPHPHAVVAVVLGWFLHGEAERLLLAPEPGNALWWLVWGARLFQEDDRHLERLPAPPEADADPLPRDAARGQPAQAVALDDGLALERSHHVARLQTGPLGGTALGDLGDDHPFAPRHPEAFRQIGRHRLLHGDAHVASDDVAPGRELRRHFPELFDRDREADALARWIHGRVDPHYGAARIEQRSAGVPRVDGRIGLDEVVVSGTAARVDVPPPLEADDAGRHRAREPERIADRHHPFPHLQPLALAHRQHRERLVAFDFQQREVGGLVMSHERAAVEPLLLPDLDRDVGGALDHVAVGGDQTVAADEESRADAAHRRFARTAATLSVHALEELAEGIVAAPACRCRDDSHHGGHGRPRQRGDGIRRAGGPILGKRGFGPDGLGGKEQRECERHAGKRGDARLAAQRSVYFWTPAPTSCSAAAFAARGGRLPSSRTRNWYSTFGFFGVEQRTSTSPRSCETTFPAQSGSPSFLAARASKTVCPPDGFQDMAAAIAFLVSVASKRPCNQDSVKASRTTIAIARGQRCRGMLNACATGACS